MEWQRVIIVLAVLVAATSATIANVVSGEVLAATLAGVIGWVAPSPLKPAD